MNIGWCTVIMGVMGVCVNIYCIMNAAKWNNNPKHFTYMSTVYYFAIGLPISLLGLFLGIIYVLIM